MLDYRIPSIAFVTLASLVFIASAAPEAQPQWPRAGQQQPTGNAWPWGAQPAYNPSTPPNVQPTPWGANPYQQAPRPTPTQDDDEPKWTPPPQWGPKSGRAPFGPKGSSTVGGPPGAITGAPKPITTRPAYCSNTDLVCTTVIDPPREPVPFKVTCGRTLYLEDDVSNAITAGCYYIKQNKKISNSDFPKPFANRQRFDFGPLQGQLYEMPLIGSAAYAGGPAGQDRVIFSAPDCFLGGELTQDASGGYTECTETY